MKCISSEFVCLKTTLSHLWPGTRGEYQINFHFSFRALLNDRAALAEWCALQNSLSKIHFCTNGAENCYVLLCYVWCECASTKCATTITHLRVLGAASAMSVCLFVCEMSESDIKNVSLRRLTTAIIFILLSLPIPGWCAYLLFRGWSTLLAYGRAMIRFMAPFKSSINGIFSYKKKAKLCRTPADINAQNVSSHLCALITILIHICKWKF